MGFGLQVNPSPADETPEPESRVIITSTNSLFQRSLKTAVREAAVTKRVTSRTFRHSFATHFLADGYDIRTVQELLGHEDVRTTMPFSWRHGIHVLNLGGRGVRSPVDGLARNPNER